MRTIAECQQSKRLVLVGARLTFLGSQSGSTIALLDELGANVLLTTAVLLESLVRLAVLGKVGLGVGLRDGRGK
jgi:hypothetical protein